jgi:hypothetical protein
MKSAGCGKSNRADSRTLSSKGKWLTLNVTRSDKANPTVLLAGFETFADPLDGLFKGE